MREALLAMLKVGSFSGDTFTFATLTFKNLAALKHHGSQFIVKFSFNTLNFKQMFKLWEFFGLLKRSCLNHLNNNLFYGVGTRDMKFIAQYFVEFSHKGFGIVSDFWCESPCPQ